MIKRILFWSLFTVATIAQLAPAQTARKYWVYFTDKGPRYPATGTLSKSSPGYERAVSSITPAALARRAKVLPAGDVVDAGDLPLYQPYLQRIGQTGAIRQRESRWLNAASFIATADQLAIISGYSFVKSVTSVRTMTVRSNYQQEFPPAVPFAKTVSLDYGPSATQNQVINTPSLHELGITGRGVIIGMLDTGFRWRAHESLQSRYVIAEHDFIQNDDTTANQAGDSFNQDQHGTLTFSTIGGYMPGKLIGPAFNAGFILAKTEYVPTETKIEEDNWANAIEWMEGLGVDVASSSLGYDNFDPQGSLDSSDYRWVDGDFNGRTSVTAIAAIHAARLGVVVCNAMGNEGNGDGVTATMLTPADADSIVSVGAVNFSRVLAGFSSTGPTNDGRTKPDVVAPGVSVYCASTSGPASYFSVSGTSLATPLTGGTSALILSARPELTPIQVRNALHNTAIPILDSIYYPSSPNNFTGWGLIDAFNAALSFGPIFSNQPLVDSVSSVSIDIASKFGIRPSAVYFHYAIGGSAVYDSIPMTLDSSMFFPTSGRYRVAVPPQAIGTLVHFYMTAADSASLSYQSPAPVLNNVWQLNYGTTGVKTSSQYPAEYALLQNYPNPFNPSTRISYDLPKREHVRVQVFDVLGRLMATLVDEVQDAGSGASRSPVVFNAANMPSGIYFYRITTPSFTSTKKMMLVR
ncbi:MAG TPA: S8 family serine peptidase [Bacteroidota bacterium]|nr:S8 family serine peptidase [Bacteroidota bacterium]